MNQVRQLAGQTAVYGMGTIIPRLLNFALVPYYTRVFGEGSLGTMVELYAYVVILNVIVTFGMETGFFRFSQDKKKFSSVYTTAFLVVSVLAVTFLLVVNAWVYQVAKMINYENNVNYIKWFSIIIALDCIAAIPFAKLRKENRARHFSILKLLNVVITIMLVVFFVSIWPKLVAIKPDTFFNQLYNPELGIGYVFLANLMASSLIFVLLIPEMRDLKGPLRKDVFLELLKYSAPLVVVGIAGSINEVADKILLKFLYTGDSAVMEQVGIYGVNFRLAVIMTLFVQMFKYAFEPFLFAQKEKDSTQLYAQIMNIFVALGVGIFLFTTLYLDVLSGLFFGNQGKSWSEGTGIVPVILLANLFLGIYYSLSVWYKVKDLTRFAAVMAIGGSVITLVLNAILIPKYSYQGSAWAHLICYASMMAASYFWGRKHMRIPYRVVPILAYLFGGVATLVVFNYVVDLLPWIRYYLATAFVITYILVVNKHLRIFKLLFGKTA